MANGSNNVENIILEHLRALRADNRAIREKLNELDDIKFRLTNLEETTGNGFAAINLSFVGVHRLLDTLDLRVDRIERRLELSDA